MLFLYFLKSLRTLYDTFFGSFKTYINKNFQIFTSFIQIKYMYYNNLLYIYSPLRLLFISVTLLSICQVFKFF